MEEFQERAKQLFNEGAYHISKSDPLGRLDEALNELDKALAIEPSNPLVLSNVATILIAQQKFIVCFLL